MDKNNPIDKANQYSIEYHSKIMAGTDDEHAIVTQSVRSHLKRMGTMLRLGDLNGKSILDVGCGLGAFYKFLLDQGITCDYHGIDINEKMIEQAKAKYPEAAGRFSTFDILLGEMDQQFDYIIVIGILNLNFGENLNMEMTEKLFEQVRKHARTGYAIGMTSSMSRKPSPETYYYKPETIVPIVTKNCNNFVLDHSYMPHDFTVFCYIDDFYGNSK